MEREKDSEESSKISRQNWFKGSGATDRLLRPGARTPTTETQYRVHGSLEGITARARWELPLSVHTEAFESSETEKENYCL